VGESMMEQSVSMTATWVDSFVASYQMDDTLPCVATIDEAEEHGNWEESRCWGKNENELESSMGHYPKYRDSDQLLFSVQQEPVLNHQPLLKFASDCLNHYLISLPAANDFPPFRVEEAYNILRYKAGQAFHGVHSDYAPNIGQGLPNRHLSFVLFLNTIEGEGGELEFPQQNLFVKPKEGVGVIFPSGWTHAHHTLPTKTETRYVLQLWWSFIKPDRDEV